MATTRSRSALAAKRLASDIKNEDISSEKVIKSKYFKCSQASTPKCSEPPLWKEQLENIRKMREGKDAPVDTMGCDKLKDENASPKVDC